MRDQNRWQMNRAGLLNFWYYDEETFDFSDGKLLLRGSNGSGKSVTMQSFLPVLLDGKKSPDRLDPFGSKARKMEDYLLGEKEIVDRDERTGYLFIEYKRSGMEQFVTTGIGLQAKRHKPLKFWGFIITDNRRIGTDLELYKKERQGTELKKVPRSKAELETLIGTGGQVVQTQTEYMKLVNKHIFGFESVEAYEELIKLLIQLRSPKLSKEFRPTVIYEILEAALPPLSDDDLRHLSDTIEQMDQTKQQIEQLERELDSLGKLNKAYDLYNQRFIADQAMELRKAAKKVQQEEKDLEEQNQKREGLEKEIETLSARIQALKQDQDTFEKQRQRLQSHKVWNLEGEKNQELERLNRSNAHFTRSDQQLSKLKSSKWKDEQRKDAIEVDNDHLNREMEDHLSGMESDALEASFAQHAMNEEDFKRKQNSGFDFAVWKKEAEQHTAKLSEMEEKLRIFERVKEQVQSKNKELADEQFGLEQKRHEEADWLRIFEQDKDRQLQEIYQWAEAHPEFDLSEDTFQKTSRILYALYESAAYSEVKDTIFPHVIQVQNGLRDQISELNAVVKQLNNKMEEKEQQLQEWKNKKDPEPEIHPKTVEARHALRNSGAAFAPLYSLIEFHEEVPSDTRKKIEAAMIDSGILNALVTDGDFAVLHDRTLIASPNMMAHTLADYLKPDLLDGQEITAEKVDDLLRSIVIGEAEEGPMSIQENGRFQIGLIKGHAIPVEQVRYIGRTARKKYREAMIMQLQEELAHLESEKAGLQGEKDVARQAMESAESAWRQFPNDKDLQESHLQIEKVRLAIKHHQDILQKLSHQLKELDEKYRMLKHSIGEQARSLNLELSAEVYQTAKTIMIRYEKELPGLETIHTKFLNGKKEIAEIERRLDEAEEDLLALTGEMNILKDDIARLQKNISQIEEQLRQAGALDIRKQIQEVQGKLTAIQNALSDSSTLLPKLESDYAYLQKDIGEKEKECAFWRNMQNAWKAAFKDELRRGLTDRVSEEETAESLATQIEKKYGMLLKEKEKSQTDARLTSEFFDKQSDLMEYRMRDYLKSQPVPEWMGEQEEDRFRPVIEQWKQKTSRRIIELDLRGQQVSPYFVQQNLESEYARQESLLDEKDKELYEEILFKSVGSKLRSRIRRAEQWSEKMNALMESRNSSSGLTFSIKWRPRTADTEEEMDTKDLVHILKQDAQLLKEQDLERITSHFRSKISKAKKWIEEKGEGHTLLQVLREVLDYRRWFSFVLSFQRTNEPKRELTNNKFFTFSGGEKAMAMYIPLFTACYSRYQEAAGTAPYIISLDEAFAGVDENNIREMFEIVEHLGFDYIMNSQVLWGDYDTISSLSVCELVRPKNADYVSVLRYRWDGNKLSLNAEEENLILT
ncbi:TIGR02680 family protein [Bacillus mangrovi]|uniref:TIGR02680 family protein n=1 Tax=Metabacillus mangrovi TaxID=1491830 RepID=A0A7X2V5A7_9BACI|nr:TIGR02680 family protein [Metabacillus mangrovi]MTH54255.1 TIGR02680 family protein [Metabacillus mangrovi]